MQHSKNWKENFSFVNNKSQKLMIQIKCKLRHGADKRTYFSFSTLLAAFKNKAKEI